MSEVKHRIGIGKLGDDINSDYLPVKSAVFTFDRSDITMDSTNRTFDETL